jgi:hypothetical protein
MIMETSVSPISGIERGLMARLRHADRRWPVNVFRAGPDAVARL